MIGHLFSYWIFILLTEVAPCSREDPSDSTALALPGRNTDFWDLFHVRISSEPHLQFLDIKLFLLLLLFNSKFIHGYFFFFLAHSAHIGIEFDDVVFNFYMLQSDCVFILVHEFSVCCNVSIKVALQWLIKAEIHIKWIMHNIVFHSIYR